MEGTVGACCILMPVRPMQYGWCMVLTLADAAGVAGAWFIHTASVCL